MTNKIDPTTLQLRVFLGRLPLDPAERADRLVHDVHVYHLAPRPVRLEAVVVLRRDLLHPVQPGAGDPGEVVVLVVVPDMPRHQVQGPVVRVRLLLWAEHVVLRDEVARHGVHAAANERGEDQVRERPPAAQADEAGVEADLDRKVGELPQAWRLRLQEDRPQRVEEELEHDPYGLADGVPHGVRLRLARDVHVDAVHALEPVVLQVVLLERYGHGDADGQVCKDAQPAVEGWGCEGKVVAQLMDGKEQVVV